MSNVMKKNGNGAESEQGRPAQAAVQRRLTFTPQVDILELPEELVLEVDLPGVKADGVEIHFERGELTVKARREVPQRQGRALVEEFEGGDFYRAFLIS